MQFMLLLQVVSEGIVSSGGTNLIVMLPAHETTSASPADATAASIEIAATFDLLVSNIVTSLIDL